MAEAALAAPAIPNASFEANTYANNQGYISQNVPITGWTSNDNGRAGINPTTAEGHVFSDNGVVPDGTNNAFIQSTGSKTTLSTTITGLVSGRVYRLQFRANARNGAVPSPSFRIGTGAEVPFHVNPPVGGSNPYYRVFTTFKATAATAALQISNNTAADSTVLIDNFSIAEATPITVTKAVDDNTAGTLRTALATAAGTAAFNVITFSATLSGATITLGSEIAVNDAGGVSIDASSLPAGLTIHGGTGNNRIFNVGNTTAGTQLFLQGLTLTSGNLTSSDGGAISNTNGAMLSLTGCTIHGNTASQRGGGIFNFGGHVLLSHCTLNNNSAGNIEGGGALCNQNGGVVAMAHCTVSGNSASSHGGGITNNALLTLAQCIVAGNSTSDPGSEDIDNYVGDGGTVQVTLVGGNLVRALGTSNGASEVGIVTSTADPLLLPLASNGGPTQTMGILPGSPALGAAVGSTATADQRGRPLFGPADLGAFEAQIGTFSFSAATYQVAEGHVAVLTITRGADRLDYETVLVQLVPGTATTADYSSQEYLVDFYEPDATATIVIPTTADFLAEGNHSFTAKLVPHGSLEANEVFAAPTTATVTIVDSIQVTNTNDAGPGSLRQAFLAADATLGPDRIWFSPALSGKTITLGSQIPVQASSEVTVDASNLAAGLTVDGGAGQNRIFLVDTGATLRLKVLTLTGGSAPSGEDGGAIFCEGVLELERCTLSGNATTGFNHSGGAVFLDASSSAVLRQCTLSGNAAYQDGGALACKGEVTLVHCTVFGNNVSTNGGGGVYIASTGVIVLDRSIVFGNTTGFSTASDLQTVGGAVNRVGASVVGALSGSVIGSGSISNADPLLGPLANNGGPTKTHALRPGSPAMNAGGSGSPASTAVTDQRGQPVRGAPDLGAYELQNSFYLEVPDTFFGETGTQVNAVRVRRTGDLSFDAKVRLFTANGTAVAPSDYTARANSTASELNFLATFGQASLPLFINNTGTDPANEPNETFTVNLGTPSSGMSIAGPASVTVVITDSSSLAEPLSGVPVPVITSPAAGAAVGMDAGGRVTVTGTATDNEGVSEVRIFEGTGALIGSATLTFPLARSTPWTFTYSPNTFSGGYSQTIKAKTTDVQNRMSDFTALRTYKILRPLEVGISGLGTVTAGYAPRSFREVGKPHTLTATAGTGYLFAGWEVLSTHTNTQLGINAVALEKNAITFIHREGLVLKATFIANPYVASEIGVFNGGITPSATLPDPPGPDVGSPSNLSTEGYATFTVQPTGGFSGTLKIDGLSLPVSGTFDTDKVARFGTSRAKSLSVARTGKPSLVVQLSADHTTNRITGTVTQVDGTDVVAVSDVLADRVHFSAANPVLATSFGGTGVRPTTGMYTMIFQVADPSPLGADEVPQGFGYGTVKVTADGGVTVAGTLADGSAISQTTTLSETGTWRLFSQLYTGLQGVFAGNVYSNLSLLGSDFQAGDSIWICPVLDRQHYSAGWPEGVTMTVTGSKFKVESNQSIIPLAQLFGAPPGDGNAFLTFEKGGQETSLDGVDHRVDIKPADGVAIEVTGGQFYSLTVDRNTGMATGTFVHTSPGLVETTLPFKAIVLQKSANPSKVFGFFLTATPNVKDYTGLSGEVRIIAQP